MEASSKKKLWIFIAVAYGVTAIMALFMIIGLKKGYDLTCFANAQMMYPACSSAARRMNRCRSQVISPSWQQPLS